VTSPHFQSTDLADDTSLAVLGLGYVGLPLAMEATRAGIPVIGFDISDRLCDALNAGASHVDDISDRDVREMVQLGFRATTDPRRLTRANTYVITVPTPLSAEGGPDLTAVKSAAVTVAKVLSAGDLVVLESTTYPGTTEEVVAPILESSGLSAGEDFYLAFSPERIDPGNPTFGLRNTPKVVGGMGSASYAAAARFYTKVCSTVVPAAGTREAELAKLLENTYRHVNIALVNEMAQFSQELGIDLWDAIRCASTKPFGFHAFYPGPGVGGHCIPIDPNYLSFRVRSELGHAFRFVELAQEVNSSMPTYVAHRVMLALNRRGLPVKGSRILLLGVAYKANIADLRETPADPLARRLKELGAEVQYWDPHIDSWVVDEPVARVDSLDGVHAFDCLVLLQAHRELDLDSLRTSCERVLDTRGVLTGAERL
jgi:nucleotide sugar dehydrogenase